MKIICTLNLKGGCAKTTTAVSMAEPGGASGIIEAKTFEGL